MVTFRDRQPPVLLVTPKADVQWIVRGRAGDWTLAAVGPFEGWVKVSLPQGVRPLAANTVSTLGELAVLAEKTLAPRLVQPAPEIQDVRDAVTPEGVVRTYRFDRAGAVLPPYLSLATPGGQKVEVLTPTERWPMELPDGPTVLAQTAEVRVRVGAPRLGEGRALVALEGGWPEVPVTDLAGLLSAAPGELVDGIAVRSGAFLDTASLVDTGWTGSTVSYRGDGSGVLDTADAALRDAILERVREGAGGGAWLESLRWGIDPYTGLLWGGEASVRLRANERLALALAIAGDSRAAFLHAALAAERALPVWAKRRGIEARAVSGQSDFFRVRGAVFGSDWADVGTSSFEAALMSPVRVVGGGPVVARYRENVLTLEWTASEAGAGEWILAVPEGVAVTAAGVTNVAGVETVQAERRVLIRYRAEAAGPCVLRLNGLPLGLVPEWRPVRR